MEFLSVLLYFPEYKASSAEELIEKLNENGIDNPITNEPIIFEDSPGNIVWETSGDGIKIKYCDRNGSLINLLSVQLFPSKPDPLPVGNFNNG